MLYSITHTIRQYARHPRYIKTLLLVFCVLFTCGLYLSHSHLLEDPDQTKMQLRLKRSTDAGEKCDLKAKLAMRNKEFEKYETSHNFLKKDVNKVDVYDPRKHVLGFLHIQKTGGSVFASYITAKSKERAKSGSKSPGDDKAKSKMNSGNAFFYMLCGLHSDWNAMNGCTEQMILSSTNKTSQTVQLSAMLLTMLRDPTERYISEWLHISRGSTWFPTVTQCSKEAMPHMEAIPACVPKVFDPSEDMFAIPSNSKNKILDIMNANFKRAASSTRYTGWEKVTLDTFMACPDNPSVNRMVNMLADHTVLGDKCNGTNLQQHDRDNRLLSSAKDSLLKMAMFGLTEHQAKTEQLLRAMLGVEFRANLQQRTENHVSCLKITESQKTAIQKLNHLDHQLYIYAKDLFYERLKTHNLL